MVTDPLTAALADLRASGVHHLGLVTPYIESIARPVRNAFADAGHVVAQTLTFGEEAEARVARIAPALIKAAARAAAKEAEAVFLSCTNLRALDIIDDLEAELGIHDPSSNQVLAWHMARATGAPVATDAPGRLLRMTKAQ